MDVQDGAKRKADSYELPASIESCHKDHLMTSLNLAVHEPNVDPQPLPVIEWSGLRVVTTETLASGYGTDEANIRKTCHVMLAASLKEFTSSPLKAKS